MEQGLKGQVPGPAGVGVDADPRGLVPAGVRDWVAGLKVAGIKTRVKTQDPLPAAEVEAGLQ
ncbi:MAG: hypothetical protein R6U38_16865 [Desulfatiglandaceae bacterium]